SVEYTQNAGTDFDYDPEHFVNTYGYLSDDATHRFKASGFLRAPWGTTLGIDYNWRSGAAYSITAGLSAACASNAARVVDTTKACNVGGNLVSTGPGYGTVYIEPRGSRRTDAAQQLDMQLMHEFTFGKVRAGLIGSIFNVFNSETPLSIGGSIGTYAPCGTATNCIDNPLFGISENRPTYQRLAVASTSFGTETSWQRPRRYEVGVRFEF
ncbi:MAG TPA: hypothetical protein VM733_12585, partial [Thermoanaerobaculia bacterium]|nr:hypothetical protein [Thermoanaerobaculia bacterium]